MQAKITDQYGFLQGGDIAKLDGIALLCPGIFLCDFLLYILSKLNLMCYFQAVVEKVYMEESSQVCCVYK